MPKFHFQIDAIVAVEAADAQAAALELERRLDEHEPLTLDGALFQLVETDERGRPRRRRRYTAEEVVRPLEAQLGRGSGGPNG